MSRFTKDENSNILEYGKPLTVDEILEALNTIEDLEESIQDVFADEEHYRDSKLRLIKKIDKYTISNDAVSDVVKHPESNSNG